MFHLSHGWYFERYDDPPGAVRIIKRDSAMPEDRIVAEITMMGEEWASVMASVSPHGETAKAYEAAMALHFGPPHGESNGN